MPTHDVLGGKVQLYKKPKSRFWWMSTTVDGQRLRESTKEDSLALAKEFAEDRYLELRGKARAGLPLTGKPKSGPTFNEAADIFEAEYPQIVQGERSPEWVQGHLNRLRLHLRPFFGPMELTAVNGSTAQQYRTRRAGQAGRLPPKDKDGNYTRPVTPPSRSTVEDEIGTVRLVLKTAQVHGLLRELPDLTPLYGKSKKVVHRPWFSLEEYKALYKATGDAAKKVPEQHRWNYEQLHDQVLFLGTTGIRPDEAKRLQHRDVTIVIDRDTGQEILEIEVRGKTGYGPCKSMPNAVAPYRRLLARAKPRNEGRKKDRARFEKLSALRDANKLVSLKDRKRFEALSAEFGASATLPPAETPKPTDLLFPSDHSDLLNDILVATGLKYDRDGKPRVFYSLRHTYICLRLLDGADVYNLAKNCRTSVEMIENHYAIHLKNVIDASAINIRKPSKRKRTAAVAANDITESNPTADEEAPNPAPSASGT